MSTRFLSVQERVNVPLPADIRRQFGLDKPGAQLEVVARAGVIELHPHVAVPADQAWFWTPSWQKGERAVDAHVAAGRVKRADDVDDFITAVSSVAGRKKRK